MEWLPLVVPGEYWYRFDTVRYSNSSFNSDGDLVRVGSAHVEVELRRFRVLSHTPKGAWLELHYGKRLVLTGSRKRYACPTIEEAAESFKARKQAQIRVLRSQLHTAKEGLRLIDAAAERLRGGGSDG
jgi:hypothetical protein